MHERRNSEKTNIKSTFSVSHPIHHPSPCAENSTKTNINSTFSILDPYRLHKWILVSVQKNSTKTITISTFRVSINNSGLGSSLLSHVPQQQVQTKLLGCFAGVIIQIHIFIYFSLYICIYICIYETVSNKL